jgi:hypothetical protein
LISRQRFGFPRVPHRPLQYRAAQPTQPHRANAPPRPPARPPLSPARP